MRDRNRTKMLCWAVVALVGVAACGGDEGAGAEAPTTAGEPAATTIPAADDAPATTAAPPRDIYADAPESTEAAQGSALQTATSGLGTILTDDDGMVLYLFLSDSDGASTCYDACASTWPPLLGDLAAGDGVDAGLIGTVSRDGGDTQVTYNGWPLYHYAADFDPGDTNGQGVGDIWFVVSPSGDAID